MYTTASLPPALSSTGGQLLCLVGVDGTSSTPSVTSATIPSLGVVIYMSPMAWTSHHRETQRSFQWQPSGLLWVPQTWLVSTSLDVKSTSPLHTNLWEVETLSISVGLINWFKIEVSGWLWSWVDMVDIEENNYFIDKQLWPCSPRVQFSCTAVFLELWQGSWSGHPDHLRQTT